MDISKLSYEKNEGLKEPVASKHDTSQLVPEETFTNASTASESYQKPMPEVEVLRIFVISGGAKREPDYFKLLQKNTSLKRILVVVRSKKGQGLNPLQMSALSSTFIAEQRFETEDGKTYILFDTDPIYMITDLDEFGEDLCRLVKEDRNQLQWIISNPCFEIWLYYHYFDSPMPQLENGLRIELSKRSQWMKQKLHELHPTDSAKALLDMQTAIANSKANFQIGLEGLPDVFSTQMHYFAEYLLDAIGRDNFEARLSGGQTPCEPTPCEPACCGLAQGLPLHGSQGDRPPVSVPLHGSQGDRPPVSAIWDSAALPSLEKPGVRSSSWTPVSK